MRSFVDDDGRRSLRPCIQSMDVFGSCNGFVGGDAVLDMRVEVSISTIMISKHIYSLPQSNVKATVRCDSLSLRQIPSFLSLTSVTLLMLSCEMSASVPSRRPYMVVPTTRCTRVWIPMQTTWIWIWI